jgi:hypothetical protein
MTQQQPADYQYKVMIVAVVHVRAKNERLARQVIFSSALGSPSADEIRLANTGQHLMGKNATIAAVDFVRHGPAELIGGPDKVMALAPATVLRAFDPRAHNSTLETASQSVQVPLDLTEGPFE